MDYGSLRPLRSKKEGGLYSSGCLSKMFHARDTIHLVHLKTTSYAQHVALNEFYDGILGLADDLIEGIQGIYGIQEISVPPASAVDPVAYLQDFYSYITGEAYNMYSESWIKNTLDEVAALTAKTLYKLKYLN